MNHKLIEWVLVGILLVIAGGIVVHAPLTVWLGTLWLQFDEVVKAWKEILMAVALVLFVVEAARRKMVPALLNDRLMQLALVYAGLHFLLVAIFENGLRAAGAGLLIDLRFIFYFVLVYGTLQLFPAYRTLFVKVFAWGSVVVIGFALLQLFILPKDILANIGYSKQTIQPYLTVDQNPNYIRVNSTLRGPNPLGAYATIVLTFIIAYALKHAKRLTIRKQQWLGVSAAATGLILGVSYSRSSLIGAFVALVVLFAAVASAKARRQLFVSVGVVIVALACILFILRDNSYISNVFLHTNPSGGSATQSNDGHVDSVVDGLKRTVTQPLGAGIGSTGSASLETKDALIIENQYLFEAHEAGWLGLGIFLWLFVEIQRRLWKRRASVLALAVFASGCGLAVIGLLLPVWTDDTISIVWWGLAAVALAGEFGRRTHGARTSN